MFPGSSRSVPFQLYRLCLAGLLLSASTSGQQNLPTPTPEKAEPTPPEDGLGRTTPRGTVLGFLSAAREGDNELAAQYLNTYDKGKASVDLAHQLFVVLDHSLPARLHQLSDQPDGPSPDSGKPNRSLVGKISSANGDVEITLEHVNWGKAGLIWLFSRETLESIPDLYEEASAVNPENFLPDFLVTTRIAHISLFEWVAVLGGIPLFYLLTILLGRILSVVVGFVARLFGKPNLITAQFPDKPVRLLLLASIIHWLLSKVHLSLLARQFWASAANVIIVVSSVWLLILATKRGEEALLRRLRSRNLIGARTLLGLGRRMIVLVIIFVGFLVILRYLGVNATAALAGLGVGGIAVALATQKTLENLIGGISILSDDAVRVGDFLRVGDTLGRVEDISLRSTRIRTLDRTLVNVPNGELANMSIAALSSRDKFAVNPILGLRYGTTSPQMQNVLNGIRSLLAQNAFIEADSVRVRFLRFGPSSLDIEVAAYVLVRDRDEFLKVQEGLLLQMMECVESAGTQIALPSQAIFLASAHERAGALEPLKVSTRADRPDEEAAEHLSSKGNSR